MKLLFLLLILFLSQNSLAQSSLEFFNSLPSEVQEQILKDEENDSSSIEIQDSLNSELETSNEEKEPNEKVEFFFGLQL